MRQFDVYENPSARSRGSAPYAIIVQSHFFEGVPTVVLAPLLIDDGRAAYSGASVRVEFLGNPYVISIPELAAIERGGLRRRRGSLRAYEDEIRRALDRLFNGF